LILQTTATRTEMGLFSMGNANIKVFPAMLAWLCYAKRRAAITALNRAIPNIRVFTEFNTACFTGAKGWLSIFVIAFTRAIPICMAWARIEFLSAEFTNSRLVLAAALAKALQRAKAGIISFVSKSLAAILASMMGDGLAACFVITWIRAVGRLLFRCGRMDACEGFAALWAYIYKHNKIPPVRDRPVLSSMVGAGPSQVTDFSEQLIKPSLSPETLYHRVPGIARGTE